MNIERFECGFHLLHGNEITVVVYTDLIALKNVAMSSLSTMVEIPTQIFLNLIMNFRGRKSTSTYSE